MGIKAEHLVGMSYELDGDAQQLMAHLAMMQPKTRRSSFVRVEVNGEIYEIVEIGFAQSDQADPHELKVYLKAR